MYGITRDVGVGSRELHRNGDGAISGYGPLAPDGGAAPLLHVLWRRRGTLALTVLACLLAASAYLFVAKRVFVATASVMVREHAPRTLGDDRGMAGQRSENYLQTQADVFRSGAVLARALDAVGHRSMKTFEGVNGDVVAWLRGNGD
jgi:uncharacterized protein involved in exopolysaccharide biosynthesis